MTPATHTTGLRLAGRYALLNVIGGGRTSQVLRAAHVETGRLVAIKLFCRNSGADDPLSEARLLAALAHRNIVEVLDAGAWSGVPYLVMPLLTGGDLAAVLQRERRLPWAVASTLVLQLCDALGHAHAHGVIHGNVQPANCIVRLEDGDPPRLTLIDFGSAALVARGHERRSHGTPAYRAPEQVIGSADKRSDVHAVGALLFHVLTGRPPLPATPGGPAPRLSWVAPDLWFSPDLEEVVARALQPSPQARHLDIGAFATALRACDRDGAPPVRVNGELGVSDLLRVLAVLVAVVSKLLTFAQVFA